jgi:GH24 family phage-related lysozyme (muramidase)
MHTKEVTIGRGIHKSVEGVFFDHNRPLEGCVDHLYSDIKNLVTIGVGQLVDPLPRALSLPLRRPDGTLATETEIEADWRAVKDHPDAARLGAPLAKKLTKLRLTEVDIRMLVQWRLDANVEALCVRFPGFSSYPAPAQLAILSLSWACGTSFRFIKLEAAIRAQDWALASTECDINPKGNPGVIPRNERNRALFLLAAAQVAVGADTSRLDLAPADAPGPSPEALAAHALAQQTTSEQVNVSIREAYGSDR